MPTEIRFQLVRKAQPVCTDGSSICVLGFAMSQDCSVNAPLSSALATKTTCGLPESRIAASWYDDRAPPDRSGWPGGWGGG